MQRMFVVAMSTAVLAAGCGRSAPEPTPEPAATVATPASPSTSSTGTSPASSTPSADPSADEAARKKADEAFDRLVEAHRNEDPDAWAIADQELAAMGAAAVPALVAGLESDSRETRELASAVLARIGANAEKAGAALTEALEDESLLVRVNAASVLALHVHTAPAERIAKLLTALKRLLAEDNVHIQKSAVVSLGNLGPHGAPAVTELTKLLDHSDAELASMTAATLGKIGPAAEEAVLALESLAKDESRDEPVRTAASDALEDIRPVEARE